MEPNGVKPAKEGTVRVILSMDKDDAQRMQEAFAEGRLTEFGVKAVNVEPAQDAIEPGKQWGPREITKRSAPPNGETPPRP
jgi:hypothetical protein